MVYLTGIAPEGHERLLGLLFRRSGDPIWISPRNAALQVSSATGFEVAPWDDRDGPIEAVRAALSGAGVVAVDGNLPARDVFILETALAASGTSVIDGYRLVERLRSRKDALELEQLTSANRLGEAVVQTIVSEGLAGCSEIEISRRLLLETVRRGSDLSFPTIVGVGPGASEPHHFPGERVAQMHTPVLIDFGLKVHHYCSDLTRVVVPQHDLSPQAAECLAAIQAASASAIALIRPGVPAEEVDRAARSVVEAAGYGQYMGGRLGHGVGIEIHEPPFIVRGNRTPLEAGNVFTVEPSIVIPGVLGVRYENVVVVTDEGAHVFNRLEPTLPLVPYGS